MEGVTKTKRARILVADDDRLILHTLAVGLRDAGYEVLVADEGEQVLAICAEARPDIVMLDVRMPGMSGPEVAARLQQQGAVPVMFLSAYGDADVVGQAVAAGALGYLVKPLDVAQIIPAIEAALAQAAEMARLRQAEANLATALSSSRNTSVAVGLIMERYQLGLEQAFEMLRSYARSRREKVAEVATRFVAAGVEIDLQGHIPPKK